VEDLDGASPDKPGERPDGGRVKIAGDGKRHDWNAVLRRLPVEAALGAAGEPDIVIAPQKIPGNLERLNLQASPGARETGLEDAHGKAKYTNRAEGTIVFHGRIL
jgi:hypothetical protein